MLINTVTYVLDDLGFKINILSDTQFHIAFEIVNKKDDKVTKHRGFVNPVSEDGMIYLNNRGYSVSASIINDEKQIATAFNEGMHYLVNISQGRIIN